MTFFFLINRANPFQASFQFEQYCVNTNLLTRQLQMILLKMWNVSSDS